jgi:hypothetical protein
MFVGLTVPLYPGIKLALSDGKPTNKIRYRDFCFIVPLFDKINKGVSRIMGNPDAG